MPPAVPNQPPLEEVRNNSQMQDDKYMPIMILLNNFLDTAALISELDLVISVDTAPAHLAGALGKPVFVLLPFNSDWRWFLEREDSPWYESARLFRQKKLGDWDDVIARVSNEVKKFIAGDQSVLRAQAWQGKLLRENPNALPL